MSHHLLDFFKLSVTKPHGSFPHLVVHLTFHCPLASLILSLGALLSLQLLFLFINPGSYPRF